MAIQEVLVGERAPEVAKQAIGLHPRCGRAGTTATYCGRCGSRLLGASSGVSAVSAALRPGQHLVQGRYSLLLCAVCGGRPPEPCLEISVDTAEPDDIIDPRD